MRILGVGLEVLDQRLWMKRSTRAQEKFIQENFSPKEISYCSRKRNSMPHYSARWACKKALLQALGMSDGRGKIAQEIEIESGTDGRPRMTLHPKVRALRANWKIQDIKISLSHTDHYSVAEVIILGQEKAGRER